MDAPELLDEMPPAAKIDDLEDLLPVIVSFLPAHESVRTCVLARRWRHVWTSTPALRITAVKGFGSVKFTQFVDRLLFLRRQGPCPLDSCVFEIVEDDFDCNWTLAAHHIYLNNIQAALDCNVRHLCCSFTPTDPTDFPEDLPEPAAPLLSQNIESIELYQIRAALDFSGCPALVSLKMKDCITLADNLLSDSLIYLSMTSCQLYTRHRTSLSLPNLVRLELTECLGRLPLLESLPSLQTAIVSLGENSEDRCSRRDTGCLNENPCWECRFAFDFDAERRMSYFFRGLSSATHLELSACYDHAFILQRDLKWLPTFPMLKTLVLDDWCLNADLTAVTYFIQHSPILEKLTIEISEELDFSMVTEKSNHPLPRAFSSDHLKVVEIKCEEVDETVYKVLKILGTFGISQNKICIFGCVDSVRTDFSIN